MVEPYLSSTSKDQLYPSRLSFDQNIFQLLSKSNRRMVDLVNLHHKTGHRLCTDRIQTKYRHKCTNSLYGSGNPAAARELFNEMQAKGLAPNICTYRILLHGMCKNSQSPDALALFRSLESKELMEDVGLYNILIDGCSKCGKPNEAMDLFDELCLKGLKPNVRTYTVMISVYCEEGLLGKCKELLRKMEENGCLPNRVTYNVLVRELLKKNECQEAEIYLEEMINRGFMPDHATFENLLPRIPNVGKDSRLRTIILKLTS
ncbi:putative tetratricopeptide-like helical domain superfamily [Helianthus annuus]|nr:putative tetratricopeptide-like helical domain superfamily [Helianthus annuus]